MLGRSFLAISLLAAGCSDEGPSFLRGGGGVGSKTKSADITSKTGNGAKEQFDALEPKLEASCGSSCHHDGAGGAPPWLASYEAIKAYEGILVPDPRTSIVLTKGPHTGPSMPTALVPDVKSWILAENAATAAAHPTIETAPIAIPNGQTVVPLPSPGGNVTFTAGLDGDLLTLRFVKLEAPIVTAIHANGVHIDVIHAEGAPTRNESLASAEATATTGGSTQLGVGLVILPKIATTDSLKLVFDTLEQAER